MLLMHETCYKTQKNLLRYITPFHGEFFESNLGNIIVSDHSSKFVCEVELLGTSQIYVYCGEDGDFDEISTCISRNHVDLQKTIYHEFEVSQKRSLLFDFEKFRAVSKDEFVFSEELLTSGKIFTTRDSNFFYNITTPKVMSIDETNLWIKYLLFTKRVCLAPLTNMTDCGKILCRELAISKDKAKYRDVPISRQFLAAFATNTGNVGLLEKLSVLSLDRLLSLTRRK